MACVACIITRPLTEAVRDQEAYAQEGIPTRSIPLQKYVPYPNHDSIEALLPQGSWRDLGGVIFTSMRAFRPLSDVQKQVLYRLPLYGVGEMSAKALQAEGAHVSVVKETAHELIQYLRNNPPTARLLYVRGERVRHPLAVELQNVCDVYEKVTYAMEELPENMRKIREVCQSHDKVILVLQSLSCASLFKKSQHLISEDLRKKVHLVCQSLSICICLEKENFASVSCAERPTALSLFQRVVALFQREMV